MLLEKVRRGFGNGMALNSAQKTKEILARHVLFLVKRDTPNAPN